MQFFAPLCTVVAQKNGTVPSGTEAITLGLKLAKTATEGKQHTSTRTIYSPGDKQHFSEKKSLHRRKTAIGRTSGGNPLLSATTGL